MCSVGSCCASGIPGVYECCPLANATCCPDHLHCCPASHPVCNATNATCTKKPPSLDSLHEAGVEVANEWGEWASVGAAVHNPAAFAAPLRREETAVPGGGPHFWSCEQSDSHSRVAALNVRFSPANPNAGDVFESTISGNFTAAVRGGSVHCQVANEGAALEELEWDLCTEESPCAEGPFSVRLSPLIQSSASHGNYTVRCEARERSGEVLACFRAWVEIS